MFACWGKLASADESSSYHPLLCHMVDVAMVTREMWRYSLSPSQRGGLSFGLGLGHDQDSAGLWCAFLAGLHDLGKASPAFQLQNGNPKFRDPARAEVMQRLRDNGLPVPSLHTPKRTLHGAITAATLPSILTAAFEMDRHIANCLSVVTGGHHGNFPTSSATQSIRSSDSGNWKWDHHRRVLVDQLAKVLCVPFELPPNALDNATAMVLAGLVSVADWVGSNTEFFPYFIPLDGMKYTDDAKTRAQEALDSLGWLLRPPQRDVRGIKELFPCIIQKPNNLQRSVETLASELTEPGLVIIEAPMGEGKTEAAIYLADNWAASAGQEGHYFALPTQATSNQMFGRVLDFMHDRYKGDIVQVQLLHGHASLSSEFDVLRSNHNRIFEPRYTGVEEDDNHLGVVAAEWFTHRKRGLLSPFGVGTIDQALLAVLQTKHVFVRLFGLAHKTVIIDEVHAYDAYMTTLLERLLEWLSALGSSVVLLSATLPRVRREALLAAYLRGLGRDSMEASSNAEYPRISWVSGSSGPSSSTVSVSPRGTKEVAAEWIDGSLPSRDGSPFPLGERLRKDLAQGGRAAVICNTVGRAQEVYRALKPYFPGTADSGEPELDLLHARYLFQDRQERERRSLNRFGKLGENTARPQVLVATQIIEQSLDLDFDLMVSDMAPADLLLQRLGRLHRHDRKRPVGLERPRLLVCRPEMDDIVPIFDPGRTAVYDSHILLRSWLTLRHRDTIRVPGDVEAIISDVYDDDHRPEDLPKPLREAWWKSQEKLQKDQNEYRYKAKSVSILPPMEPVDEILEQFNGELEEDNPEVHETLQALRRLSGLNVQAIIVEEQEVHDVGGRTIEELLMKSVPISHRGIARVLLSADTTDRWKKNPLLRHYRLITLNAQGRCTVGTYALTLDPELGVRIIQSTEDNG